MMSRLRHRVARLLRWPYRIAADLRAVAAARAKTGQAETGQRVAAIEHRLADLGNVLTALHALALELRRTQQEQAAQMARLDALAVAGQATDARLAALDAALTTLRTIPMPQDGDLTAAIDSFRRGFPAALDRPHG